MRFDKNYILGGENMSIIVKDNKLYDSVYDMYVEDFDDYELDETGIINEFYLDECENKYIVIDSESKIVNGSLLSIGDMWAKTTLKVDQHFNWFQKIMWKWAFGIKVEDYSEE